MPFAPRALRPRLLGLVTMVDQVNVVRASLSRRTFVKAVGGAGVGFALYVYLPDGTRRALAQMGGAGVGVQNTTPIPAA